MNKIKIILLTFLIAIYSGFCVASEHEHLTEKSISIKIVPTSVNENGDRLIILRDPSDRFHVVMTNVSKESIRIWKENNSWGYFNLSFRVKDKNGKIFSLKKKPKGWNKNFPDWTIVPPGNHRVFEVMFDDSLWEKSPLPERGESAVIKLQALYEIHETKEAKEYEIWTGQILSDESEYIFYN